jgi:hypothetical protein
MTDKIATEKYRGELNLAGIKIPCLVLDDGTRIITEEGLANFLSAMNIATPEEVNEFGKDFSKFMEAK